MTEIERCELAKSKGITYDPNTGEVRGTFGNVLNSRKQGYVFFRVCKEGKGYSLSAHRFAWFSYYGELPKNFIDHIDCNRSNNRINNLRDVTNSENHMNREKVKGYCWSKESKKYRGFIKLNKKLIHLGYFDKEEDARNAYLEAKKKYHIIPNINPSNG